ncbi:MAG TPA: DUF2782 domain-containing protein [Pseudomonadales bacterium]|nr:DUF2782 domain-containing protein [Pseudomonadales bacterium]
MAGLVAASNVFAAAPVTLSPPDQNASGDIQIVEGKDRTIFEYRNNGYLMMIKIVPKHGRPYYMVPADGAPLYKSLDYGKKLYPSWIIIQW